ncbi:putative cobalt-precorrin-6Y C(15)-methyltransferase [Methanobrevibacter curvatus]|uniref:Probable cobalt-precorrin-6B C(15)-methyltransferase (decarboxylating) n=2 Tax=Methanobrevibacter curvatus TaxID=49547 RepID=A0A166B148_9EURY|nr:putative cobalt-precorrin-6Y C(15)-methyltransferase [Methanobrevibacter curvatus]
MEIIISDKMITDDEFIKNNSVPGPTKEEIRCIVLCKTNISKEDKVLEIGCGTGGLTCEIAKKTKNLISIDKNPKAIETTKMNLKKFNLYNNVKLIKNDGLSIISNINSLNKAIIGGSGNDLEEIIAQIDKKIVKNGKIIVTAILIDTKVQSINQLKKLAYETEIIEVNISKGKILDRGIMMISQNPIAIITGTKK